MFAYVFSQRLGHSVSLDDRSQEWGSKGLFSLFARIPNLFSRGFHKMLSEMARFNREAPRLLLMEDDDPRKVHGSIEAHARFRLDSTWDFEREPERGPGRGGGSPVSPLAL